PGEGDVQAVFEVMWAAGEGHGDPGQAEVGEPSLTPLPLEVDDRQDPVAGVNPAEDDVEDGDGSSHGALRSGTPIWRMNSRMELASPMWRASRRSTPVWYSARDSEKVEPAPGLLCTVTRPPIAST